MTARTRRDTSARARELGASLREARQRTAMSGRALARRVDWPEAKVCQMETGTRPASSVDVAAYLAGCGPLDRPEYRHLVALAKEPDTGFLLRPHSPELPDELRSLIVQESLASTIASYDPLAVPGLLQTERYIRELFRWASRRSADEIELRVRARLARQELLHQPRPPACTFFIQEHALRTTIGDASVMCDQLLSLTLASSIPGCAVRVVPESAGPFSAIGGMFKLLGYAVDKPVGYTEGLGAGVFMEQTDDIERYRHLLTMLDRNALDAGQSRAWLADLASAYDRVEADTTCPPASRTG